MTGKKIIANLLLLSITGLSGYFNGVQAVVSDDEWKIITSIESRRHDLCLKFDPIFKARLISDIIKAICLTENMNIEFYYQSVLCKLLGRHFNTSFIRLDDKALYEKEFFATLIYRILGYKLYNNIPINPQELSYISGFLTQKIKNLDDFKKLNDMDKLNITRICLMCSEHHVLDRPTLEGVLEIIGCFIETNTASPKLLITFGKTPHNTTKQVYALKEAIVTIKSKNPEKAKYDPHCIEALIALGKIPHNREEEIQALNQAIGILDELGKPQDDPQRIEAVIAFSKIKGPQQSTLGVRYLEEIIRILPPDHPQRADALITLGKIRHNKENETHALKEAIRILPPDHPQRIEALLTLARIPHNTDEQINALEELNNLRNPELTKKIKKIARDILTQCKCGRSIDDRFNCFRLEMILEGPGMRKPATAKPRF